MNDEPPQRQFTELPPLGLYVHIPWCIRKCPYCDFNSHEQRGELPEQQYVEALLDDLTHELPQVWGRQISSIFIGGGTPSLFSPAAMDRLLSGIRALTGFTPDIEVTMEANPGTFEQERFRDFHALGINRLSIGIQSFDEGRLKALGRVHSSDEALKAVEIAHTAGFEQINLDLMFALPEQDMAACLSDVQQALDSAVTHLSFYELTMEPNTLFARFPPPRPDQDLRADMQDAVVSKLAEGGYDRYEISAFAKAEPRKDHRCQHNLNYWLFGDYIGIGAGAHGKITRADNASITRRMKQRHPATYLQAESADQRVIQENSITHSETALEFMMNALRLREGFPLPVFYQHTGVVLDDWQAAIDEAMQRGWLEQSGLNIRATDLGYRWLNEILELFMPSEDSDRPSGDVEKQTGVKRYKTVPLVAKD